MADKQDWQSYPVHFGLLVTFVAGIVFVLASFVSVQTWLDDRIDRRLANYANENIIPRLVALERSVSEFQSQQEKILSIIESQDHSRNRQYGEIKKNQEEIRDLIKRIRNH